MGHGNMGYGMQKRTRRDMERDNMSSKLMTGETKAKRYKGRWMKRKSMKETENYMVVEFACSLELYE